MRRTDNSSFKNYEFKIEQEQLEERPIECVKPVDTSVSGLMSRGVVPQQLRYGVDIPAMDNMDLMEFRKMKEGVNNSVERLERLERLEKEEQEYKVKKEQENKEKSKEE